MQLHDLNTSNVTESNGVRMYKGLLILKLKQEIYNFHAGYKEAITINNKNKRKKCNTTFQCRHDIIIK